MALAQQLFTFTSDNIDVVLPQLTIDAGAKETIHQAVASGRVAFVSQHDVKVGNWRRVGYMILDPETGSGAYLISGGINGGVTALAWLMGVITAIIFVSGLSLGVVAVIAVLASTLALVTIIAALIVAASSLILALTIMILIFASAESNDMKQCFAGSFMYGLIIVSTKTFKVS